MNLLKIVKEYIHANPNSKKISRVFWQILSLKNSFAKTSSAFRPATLPEYLEGRTPKRKMSFPFSEKIGRAQIRKARNIFSFWGCRVKRGGGGAFSERMGQFQATTHAERATSFVLEIGASLVQYRHKVITPPLLEHYQVLKLQ